MERTISRDADDIDLGLATSRIMRRWRVLLVAGVLGAVLAFGVSRLLPKTYESRALVYVQQNTFTSSLMSAMPVGFGIKGGASSYLVALLRSETMLRNVAGALGMLKKGASEEKVLDRLGECISITDDKNGGIEIKARARSPLDAAKIANMTLDNLAKLVVTRSKRQADFISEKLDETNRKLRDAEDELLNFQEKHGIAAIDEETKALIDDIGSLDARMLALDMDMRDVDNRLVSEDDLNALVDLEIRKKSLESSRAYLEEKIRETQGAIAARPAAAVTYARLQRNVTVLSKTFELLTEQYQLANISQQGEDGDYQVIDKATPIERPVLPRPAMNAGIGGLLSICFAAVLLGKPAGKKSRVRK